VKHLWPIVTGRTIIDVWTIVHVSFWIYAGSIGWSNKVKLWHMIIIGFALSLVWEAFEKFAEKKWPHLWLNPESFVNSWISDPLTSTIGICFIYYALNHWRFE
jgi:hypothetical protein